jgi:crotonobetainyl-CoA:carnitine CoA-transferase CaiB-like acyl-CoA transferase
MTETGEADRPLAGIRVLDLVRGPLAPITRYFAELGARVDRVDSEPPDFGDFDQLAANAGKHRHVLVLDDPAARDLIAAANVIVADAGCKLDLAALRAARPRLVTMTVSDFGTGTSLAHWQATGPVLHALSGELSRSGIRGREPLLPPGDLAYQCAASQAAYALVTSLFHALRCGAGDHLDFSALNGAVQALDPGYGISGSATMGKPAHLLSRDRPATGFQYPILRCADGYVRICLLAKRQWQGMFRWMGEPAAFASPEFDKLVARYKSPTLLPAIATFFAKFTRRELENDGQRFGVPISGVLTFKESVESDHMRAREAVRDVRCGDGSTVRLPNGVISIDGVRMGLRTPQDVAASWTTPPERDPGARAFEGLRVLDLGVIVVGAEQGRLLADQGADVVKIESQAYPDGNRQSYLSYGISVSFAAGHRNKRSVGINLRQSEGRALFLKLAAKADVIFSNFKPGTLEGLGLGYADVATVNPWIIMADSSAFGPTGPWSGRMGYGPLVRAATGLALAWRYPDDPESFSDSVTIYPDHVAARIGVIAVVALLIRRLRTGCGGVASSAQSEVMLNHFGADVARTSRGLEAAVAADWPWSVYRARGDDEWCVVTVRGQSDWEALCSVIEFEGAALNTPSSRLRERSAIDLAIQSWMAGRDADEAMRALQKKGVPAARMLRVSDLPEFDYYAERGFYRTEAHPYLVEEVIAERSHANSARLAEALFRPAPLMGEHSASVVAEWLTLGEKEIDELVASGVLEPVDAAVLADAHAAVTKS